MHGAQVWSLVGKLKSQMAHGTAKNLLIKKKIFF